MSDKKKKVVKNTTKKNKIKEEPLKTNLQFKELVEKMFKPKKK